MTILLLVFNPWSLELLYRNAPPYQNAIFVSSPTKNCVTSRIMIEKASNHIETVGLSLQNDCTYLSFHKSQRIKNMFNVMTQYKVA